MAEVRQHFNDVERLCKETQEAVYLTKNGEGTLVIMDLEAFEKREKMLDLKERLIDVEKSRKAGRKSYSIDELEQYLDDIISER